MVFLRCSGLQFGLCLVADRVQKVFNDDVEQPWTYVINLAGETKYSQPEGVALALTAREDVLTHTVIGLQRKDYGP